VRHVIFVLKPELDLALQSLTIDLLRIILIAPTIFGVSGLLMSILNTHQRFWLPALAPVFNWVGWILGIVFLVPSMGIFGLAWGYVIGAILHLAVQIPGLLQLQGQQRRPGRDRGSVPGRRRTHGSQQSHAHRSLRPSLRP